ncbi:MAG: hypothetical protein EON51_17360 [Acinetobacter sp.]|nr:MAG: hypothetical protein EON51_17360 [Acinetobacter sp.]
MIDEVIKNYHKERDRKFTFLSLEIRQLDTLDVFSLIFYGVAIGVHFLLQHINFSYRIFGLIYIPLGVWFVVITTPFGLRFRNVYFFCIWGLLSIIFLFAKTSVSYFPISCFILYQIIRLIFRKNHRKEFIPYNVGRGKTDCPRHGRILNLERFVSKLEGRGGYIEDRYFMKWLFWLGTLFLLVCLLGMLGVSKTSNG